MKHRLVLVTDPLCSWCWGMATEFQLARQQLADVVEFDLMLGGINIDGSQPIGDYGRRFLMRLWHEVEATTGQPFGYLLPDEYIHNSARTCAALQALRMTTGQVPFDYLHELQRLFFVQGQDVTQMPLLLQTAEQFGGDPDVLAPMIESSQVIDSVRDQFRAAKAYGTQALPSLLHAEQPGELKLFAGGFVDAAMLVQLVENLQQAPDRP